MTRSTYVLWYGRTEELFWWPKEKLRRVDGLGEISEENKENLPTFTYVEPPGELQARFKQLRRGRLFQDSVLIIVQLLLLKLPVTP